MKLVVVATAVALMAHAHPGFASESAWPPLPKDASISGRAANEDDVAKGRAIFVAKVGNVIIGKPMAVQIPQYAYWKDQSGRKVPVVVIQAEEANGTKLFGFRDTTGKTYVATGPEIELLGRTLPK